MSSETDLKCSMGRMSTKICKTMGHKTKRLKNLMFDKWNNKLEEK